jgi:hypothetical protein
MRPLDTHPEAFEVQLGIYRRMTGEQRVQVAAELTRAMDSIARGGIRARHPSFTEVEVSLELIRILYGDEVRRAIAAATSRRD